MKDQKRGPEEEGAILLMTLIFLSVIGLIASALASGGFAVTRQSFSTQKVQARETGTNAGLEWAVNTLRNGKDGFCEAGLTEKTMTLSGREVRVTCKGVSSSTAGVNSFAIYINPATPANSNYLGTSSFTNGAKSIVGPIYNAGKGGSASDGWDLKALLNVDGNVLVPISASCPAGGTALKPTKLVPLYGTVSCANVPIAAVTPQPIPAPCSPLTSCENPPVTTVAGCSVFEPGFYSTMPVFSKDNNYFKSGVYYFDFNGIMTLGSSLIGGGPGPATATSVADVRFSSIPLCAVPLETNGVVFVFGDKAGLKVTNLGRIELFTYKVGSKKFPNIATAQLPGVTAGAPWTGSKATNIGLNKDLISVGTAQPEFIMHSGAFVPQSGISLKGSNDAIEVFRGTVVAGRLDLQASGSIDNANFGVIVPAGGEKKYVLMANSCPGERAGLTANACSNEKQVPPVLPVRPEPQLCSVASLVIYDDSKRTVWLDNWRVDRDAGTSDPATCNEASIP
jgi:hypothetical protein